MKTNVSRTYFLHFLLFNLCFFGLQLLLVISKNVSFVSGLKLPAIVLSELGITLVIHIVLYLILSLIQTVMLIGILNRSWHYFSPEHWQIIIWVLWVCSILSANCYYFPLSIFSTLLAPPLSHSFIIIFLGLSLTGLFFLALNCLFYRAGVGILALGIPIFCAYLLIYKVHTTQQHPLENKPNIIIIGIDSLSPERIHSDNMPFFSQQISNSTQFTNTISPLARTYPAWSTILTGMYAEHHHAEENLIAKNLIKSGTSIAWLLDKQGYNTIFATDDRRFNSIGKEFGFQHIIGPKLGVNDVLLGSFNDFPLSNLIINSRISAWLFPYNFMSRASFFSYYPGTFSEQLEHELSQQPTNRPVFLAVHFTLPHWPYAWAESSPQEVNDEFSTLNRDVIYQSALRRVDKQFATLFLYLQTRHYFDDSLVILLSDHGETLYAPHSRLTNIHNYQGKWPSKFALYLANNTATDLDKSAGHGSDILSPEQYHSVLGFNIYKNGQLTTSNKLIAQRVALQDLAPTILEYLKLVNPQTMDGISLLQAILNPEEPLPNRVFFIESGMFPNQKLSKEKSMEIGRHYYQVNPETGEIEIKSDELKFFDDQKLYGILSGNWVLALYPDRKNYIAVIQNLTTGQWSDDLHSDFAKTSPAEVLYQQLHEFYEKKLFLPLN